MTSFGFKPNRVEASCLINTDRMLMVWRNGDLVIFSINGSSVVLHKTDTLRLAKEISDWMKPS